MVQKKRYIQISGLLVSLALLWLWLTIATAAQATPPHAPAQPQAEVNACGTISAPTTWTAGNVYTASNCAITIATGVTLTVEPGTTVKFAGGQAVLIVYGSLVAQGTEAQPITFSSLHDDAHGQPAAGSSGAPAAEDWYGIHFFPGSSGQISHAFIGYGTAWVAPPVVGWNKAQVYVDNAAIAFDHVQVAYGHRPGIYLIGNGADTHITNSFIHDHNGTAIYQSSINMQPTYSNLTFSGNDRDEVTLGSFEGALTQNVTLGGANFGVECGSTACHLTVPASMTLTVLPGTLLDLRASYGIIVASGGSLIAEGTPTQPITFTSRLAADGDAGQYWAGLAAQQGSTLRLDHCDISYADYGCTYQSGLDIRTDDAIVNNCHIHHHKQNGLYIFAPNGAAIHPVMNNVDVTDNGQSGVYLDASNGGVTSVTWDGGHISNNGWSGVTGYTSNSILNPTLRNLTIAGNGAAGDLAGRYDGIYWNAQGVNPILESLTITGNVGTAIHWLCNGSITARNLTAAGNGLNELTLPGCAIGGGRQWDVGDAGIPLRVTDHIEVSPNALLSLTPGTTLRFDKNQYGSPTYLRVQDQAALYALGTAEKPIIFTGAVITDTGWWAGIEGVGRAAITLRHCEIAYGGCPTSNPLAASLVIRWGTNGVPAANIQNCEIHHSGMKGVQFHFYNLPVTIPPVFRYNNLHDNTQEAVTNFDAPPLDARDNYWGDPTGPRHATQNPGGLGDTVGNNILFYPWLGAPATGGEAPGEMLVSTGAPSRASPGQTVDYAIQYFNLMTETVQNAVLMLQLPNAAEYVDSTEGGIYWPARHQVFWVLGDIAPGDHNYVAARLRYAWGLSSDYRDGSITLLSGTNYNAGALNLSDYTNYDPAVVNDSDSIPQATFDALRAANPDLETLYQEALGQGFAFVAASHSTFEDGTDITSALLSTADRQTKRVLSLFDSQALAATFDADSFTLHDTTGGMTFAPSTNSSEYWGDWSPAGNAAAVHALAGCTETMCKVHCVGKDVTLLVVTSAAQAGLSWATFGLVPPPDAFDALKEVTKTIMECKKDCDLDPLTGCCTAEGQVRWTPGYFSGWCGKAYCNPTLGTYGTPGQLFCPFGTKCVAGTGGQGGCLACEGADYLYSFDEVRLSPIPNAPCALTGGDGGDCTDTGFWFAKDPNAIYGPAGDLLPGQVVTYTLTYENEGEGRAYGVYVVNALPEVFDARTISFTHGSGVYVPDSRELFWLVGELGPKGAADSEGVITYTVALTGGLASGTVVANQAVVYFPSVPEETPTNTWVNLVMPLAANPLNLTTAYMTPLSVTLSGREISGLPLDYEVIEQPRGGILAGTPPNLTYTPVANFTGADGFTFRVSNAVTESRPAQVYVTVTPDGDTTPPQVLWTHPAADAINVEASVTPVLTDTAGPVYTPVIRIGVSEALSATTVTSATVTLARDGGAAVPISAYFDGGLNQIIITPRVALTLGDYTVTVNTGVTDLAGNPLAADYQWQFSVGGALPYQYIYLPLVLRGQ